MALITQYNVQLVGIVGVSMRMEGRSQVLEEEVGRTVSKLLKGRPNVEATSKQLYFAFFLDDLFLAVEQMEVMIKHNVSVPFVSVLISVVLQFLEHQDRGLLSPTVKLEVGD